LGFILGRSERYQLKYFTASLWLPALLKELPKANVTAFLSRFSGI